MNYNKDEYKKNKIKAYYKNKYKQKKQVEKYIKLKNNDIVYKIINNLSKRIYHEFNNKNIKRASTYMSFIGCTPEILKNHISDQFVENMSFENYGEWVIDHIIPISSFNLEDINEAKKCFNYLNLQPLWKKDNLEKSNKMPE